MKRIQEKVKDLIEACSYESLRDFISNPSVTLNNYHFTDATADMMSKWLDAAAEIYSQKGAAKALAGYRGVGKSHFLAAFGAIVSHPELRSGIADSHVAASAERLKRRRHPIAFVRRGTFPTLIEEIKNAIAVSLNQNVNELSDSLPELLKTAAEKAADLPFILIVDTAWERESRVARDDGGMLGEIAELALNLNIFVAVALDDDIAGADGLNASIAQNYTIDYLDQEHLYRIVDTHIFPKHRRSQNLLNEIYGHFRQILPSFRWSEQRFTSLYPLHPVILEIAPFVRLYLQDFNLLGFAAESGSRTLNRPADSLVALDEVFDRTETNLRKADELKDTFELFDQINTTVIGQIPVMQRLQAKLILKALLLLSLDGEGKTAADISSAMLIYDENEPERAVKSVESILASFVAAFPELILPQVDSTREPRFCFKIGAKDNFNQRLNEIIQDISPDVIPKVLRRVSQERFSDWAMPADNLAQDRLECQIVWRGSPRRVNVIWNWKNENLTPPTDEDFVDFEIIINPQLSAAGENLTQNNSKIVWQPAELKKDEIETILRFYALLTDADLREQYSEQIRAAGQAHTISVDKIWQRVFLDESSLLIGGQSLEFSAEAKESQSLSQMFSQTIEPIFAARFPHHPQFADTLGAAEVEKLIRDLFSGTNSNLPEIQKLAADFALPFGLVTKRDDNFVLESEENLVQLPLASEILSLVERSAEKKVSLKSVYQHLRREPFGLVLEAQKLMLVALVAQRQIEFVTSKGNRINRRSLDLKIIWDDIEGIAQPFKVGYSNERLIFWVQALTGSSDFRSIDTPADETAIKEALKNWLSRWQSMRISERFADLPDDALNTKIWRLAAHTEKSFGTIAATIKSITENVISLEEGLQRIADTFSDREEEFVTRTDEMEMLRIFLDGARQREKVWAYLSVCEPTDDEKIEDFRRHLWQLIDAAYQHSDDVLNQELENIWQTFYESFSEHFAVKHDSVMNSRHLKERFDEIMRSDEWREFETLSQQPIFRPAFWQETEQKRRRFDELNCCLNVREMLKTHPFCACSFNLTQTSDWEELPEQLWESVNRGRAGYRRTLSTLTGSLIPLLEQLARTNNEFTAAAENLKQVLQKEEIPLLSNEELIVIGKALQAIPKNSHTVQAGNN